MSPPQLISQKKISFSFLSNFLAQMKFCILVTSLLTLFVSCTYFIHQMQCVNLAMLQFTVSILQKKFCEIDIQIVNMLYFIQQKLVQYVQTCSPQLTVFYIQNTVNWGEQVCRNHYIDVKGLNNCILSLIFYENS